MPSVTAAQMAEADRVATLEQGIPALVLMENAARAVARLARGYGRIVVLAGHGNNGGDGLAAARHLLGWGADVVCAVDAPETRRPDARLQRAILERLGAPLVPLAAAPLARADLVVDGLLGYGSRGAAHGPIGDAIVAANGCGAPILAIDLPSGLDPDTGAAPGPAIRARVTVTLGLPKRGLLGSAHVGTLYVADIGIPPAAYAGSGIDARAVFAKEELVRV